MPKVPLFITRYSLSRKNAIGVQTNFLLNSHPDWLHFFWHNPELAAGDRRSIRLDNILFGRVSFFQTRHRYVEGLERLGFGWWDNDRLRETRAKALVRRYQSSVSVIYVSPLDARDANRIRQLVQLFERPFVLHLWDFLDQKIPENEDLGWLIQNARKVFCVSQPMLNEICPVRPDSESLIFSRGRSHISALPPSDQTLRIVLVGNIYSYRHGLDLLNDAVERLEAKGTKVSVCYVGPQTKQFSSLNSSLVKRLEPLGFIQGDENRDRILGQFHVAFLPGPYRDPDLHMRSRYSIPSRVLDFLATGLPIVGTVQPRSATGIFCESLGVHAHCFCQTSGEVENALMHLTHDQSEWLRLAGKNRQAFERLLEESQPEKLKRAMELSAAG